jgi:hypothetical protein
LNSTDLHLRKVYNKFGGAARKVSKRMALAG